MLTEDQLFQKIDFTRNPFPKGDYEQCEFVGCNFSGVDLNGMNFSDCLFRDCDLSMIKCAKTGFKSVRFLNCKLLGIRFEACNPFLLELSFENCLIKLSSFFRLSLKQTVFKNCEVQEVDFTEADLSKAVFEQCDLNLSTFDRSNLERANLSSASRYIIDPEKNRIKGMCVSRNGLEGLLQKHELQID